MVSMDMLVIKIMNFAQRLVDADRASLFLGKILSLAVSDTTTLIVA